MLIFSTDWRTLRKTFRVFGLVRRFLTIDSSSDTIVRVFNRWANGEVNIFGIWVISLMVYCIENIDKISTSSV